MGREQRPSLDTVRAGSGPHSGRDPRSPSQPPPLPAGPPGMRGGSPGSRGAGRSGPKLDERPERQSTREPSGDPRLGGASQRASPPPLSVAITSCFSSAGANRAPSARLPPPRTGPRGAGAARHFRLCVSARVRSPTAPPPGWPLAKVWATSRACSLSSRRAHWCEDSAPHPLKRPGAVAAKGVKCAPPVPGSKPQLCSLLVSRGLRLPGLCSPWAPKLEETFC